MGNPVVHFEVMGSDLSGLRSFYSELFGWTINEMPEINYASIDTLSGKGIGGGLGVDQNGESFTTFYIEVDDVDAALEAIKKAGGSVLRDKIEMPGIVTFAHFADPAGNRMGVVQSDDQSPPSAEPQGKPAVGWFEIVGSDADGLADFYSNAFGWKSSARHLMPGDMIYHEMDTRAGTGPGINGGIGSPMDGQARVTIYAGVPDVSQTLKQAEQLGASIVMPETRVTDTTVIGLFVDPQGHLFGVYQDDE